MTDGWITDIQGFSLHDGPGVRTTVFFAGCNLRCRWCHNPEALSAIPRLQFFADKCSGCGNCMRVCPLGAPEEAGSACASCGKCVEHCPSKARTFSCYCVTPEDVFAVVQKDAVIYQRINGGITFSGGEPFLQSDFLRETARLCQNAGLHTAVETAAEVDYELIMRVMPFIDMVICDLKAMNEDLHISGTGASNRRILENIRRMSRDVRHMMVRVPVVPGFNDTIEEISAIATFTSDLRIKFTELLPFHSMATPKYRSLGMEYGAKDLQPPSPKKMAELEEVFYEH